MAHNPVYVETVKLAGSYKWSIEVEGMLDVECPMYDEEIQAEQYAKQKYPNTVIFTTSDSEHYSNRNR